VLEVGVVPKVRGTEQDLVIDNDSRSCYIRAQGKTRRLIAGTKTPLFEDYKLPQDRRGFLEKNHRIQQSD
jgi:hypothetical protein